MKELTLEIQAQNALKAFAKTILSAVLPQLTQFIGKKIFLGDGSKSKIFNIDINKFAPAPIKGMHVQAHATYLTNDYGKLQLKVGICLNGGSYDVTPKTAFCKYLDRQIELGILKDGQNLDSIIELDKIVKAYELDEVLDLSDELEKIATYRKLQTQADKSKELIKVDASFYKYL